MSRNAVIEAIEQEQLKSEIPDFAVGDTIKIHVRIVEGGKERVQAFTGTVIARKGSGLSETVSLYRVAYGTAVERVFILHSPNVTKIEVTRRGKTRRAKLYHIRGAFGKAARIKENIVGANKAEAARVAAKKEAARKAAEKKAEEPTAEEQKPESDEKGAE